jgi:hypothetical protein
VTAIEGALLATLKKPAPDTTCNPDPPIEKPEWWDALPVPDGVSAPTSLPTLSAAVAGTSSSQIFSEMRTTTLSPQDAISAYTSALGDKGFQQFDAPSILPIDGVEQGAYSDFGTRTMVVLAIGPKAFDDKGLESAKAGIPANTTVLWLFAAPT